MRAAFWFWYMGLIMLFVLVCVLLDESQAQETVRESHCMQGQMDEQGCVFFKDIDCATVPAFVVAQVPTPKTWEIKYGRPASFLTFRSKWQDPPLRNNKQTFRAPAFILGQGALVASMVVACRRKNSGEDFHSEAPAVSGLIALDYLMTRFISMPHALGPAVYGIIHYSRSAAK